MVERVVKTVNGAKNGRFVFEEIARSFEKIGQ